MVICQICNHEFKQITNTHLKVHNLTIIEYKRKFPLDGIGSNSSWYKKGNIPWMTGRKNIWANPPEKTPAIRYKISQALKGRPQPKSEEHRKNLSISALKGFANGRKNWNKGLTKETDQRLAEAGIKISLTNKGRKRSPESIVKQVRTKKENSIAIWNKGLTKETDARLAFTEKRKIDTSIRMKAIGNQLSRNTKLLWQDPAYVSTQMQARHCKPNKKELKFQELLDIWQPNEWIYVGDGKIREAIIGGKCPDFWNGDHKFIELFGNYWHQNDNPQDKIDHYKRYDYDCLVIWENELNDLVSLQEKTFNFSSK